MKISEAQMLNDKEEIVFLYLNNLTYMTGSPGAGEGEPDMLADTWEETTKRPCHLKHQTSKLQTLCISTDFQEISHPPHTCFLYNPVRYISLKTKIQGFTVLPQCLFC